ncbi:MAG TPA: hypothetical protein VNT99_12420 [Methylomirabilota bacterium]|nr:hypothetical protein [Methylomirabilota bacterium]
MNTEELTQKKKDGSLHFDAHEFDGLRDALEKEAEGTFAKLDHFVRSNPVTSLLIAAAAGFAVASAARRACARKSVKGERERS